jgi:hypothetical protein
VGSSKGIGASRSSCNTVSTSVGVKRFRTAKHKGSIASVERKSYRFGRTKVIFIVCHFQPSPSHYPEPHWRFKAVRISSPASEG